MYRNKWKWNHDNPTTQNIWDSVKPVLINFFVVVVVHNLSQETRAKSNKWSNFTPKVTRKRRNEDSLG